MHTDMCEDCAYIIISLKIHDNHNIMLAYIAAWARPITKHDSRGGGWVFVPPHACELTKYSLTRASTTYKLTTLYINVGIIGAEHNLLP